LLFLYVDHHFTFIFPLLLFLYLYDQFIFVFPDKDTETTIVEI
jgi:hypothetical protein